MKTFFKILSLSLLFTACTTTPPAVEVTKSTDLMGSGVTMPLKLDPGKTVTASSGCFVSLRREGQVETRDVKFLPGKEKIFAELAPGKYRFKEVYCGLSHWDLAFIPWQAVEVFPNKISLASGLALTVDGYGQMQWEFSSRATNQRIAKSLLTDLNADDQTRVVSAYTGKPIQLTDVENTRLSKDEPDYPSAVSQCLEIEKGTNPLWLGNLKIEAKYRAKKLVQYSEDPAWNTFSAGFKQCVYSGLKAYRPKTGKQMVMKVQL
jgi:hypothetical protein